MPKVSIIVPCYNSEEYIHRCVDSLVYQTLEEIEILIVDNQSTDRTWEIVKSYEAYFPEKVKAFKLESHFNGPGAGRNCGLFYAQADFIGFADSDDYFEYDAFEKMYQKAIEEGCDLVYAASFDVQGSDYHITRRLPTGSREEILTIGSMVFWNKLIHRSLFELVGKIPEDLVFEDLAYCAGLVSYAKKIGYIDEPLYYYIIREDSGVNTMEPDRVLKSIEAENIAISLCNPKYMDYLTDSIAMRNCNNIRDRWQFTDQYIEQLFKLKPYLDNNEYFKRDQRNYRRVWKYYHFITGTIPRRIYMNNFEGEISETLVAQIKETAFWNGCEVILLDESTCDINIQILKKCVAQKNYQTIAQYYALKKIYESGGIYLGPCIELENPLNFLLHLHVFFAYVDEQQFSDQIFGAAVGNAVIQTLLSNFVNKMKSGNWNLSDTIKETLRVDYNMPITGKTNVYNETASVFAKEVFAVNKKNVNLHMACHNFKQNADQEAYITIKRTSMN